MTGEVIKEFLLSLGFEVDSSSLSKFNNSIASATKRVALLATGIQAATASVVYGISKISESFEDLGYEYKILAPAINKAIILRHEMFRAYAAAGVNLNKVVFSAAKLNLSITKTRYVLDAIYKSVGAKFFDLITKQSDIFRKRLYDNMPKIQAFLERLVKSLFELFRGVVSLGERAWSILGRIYDFFVKLDDITGGWSTKILAFIAAWQALNLAFLSTPLGMILTGLLALLALYDDFKTFQEGGESLFNWSKFIPVIDAVTKAFESLVNLVKSFLTLLSDVGTIIGNLFEGKFKLAWEGVKDLISDSVEHLKNFIDLIKNYFSSIGSVLGFIYEIGKPLLEKMSPNLQTTPNGIPYANPEAHMNHTLNNQNINQQTNINVIGSPDAASTGKMVASEQNKVNLSMSRYLSPRAQ